MTDSLVSALLRLPYITADDDARALLAQAAMSGADPQKLRAAWNEWRAERARSVVTIEGISL